MENSQKNMDYFAVGAKADRMRQLKIDLDKEADKLGITRHALALAKLEAKPPQSWFRRLLNSIKARFMFHS